MLHVRRLIPRGRMSRTLSSRASNVLASLDISTTHEISGVYDGEWRGSGDLVSSTCPTTGEVLARVKTATPEELHIALERTREAYTHFRSKSELRSIAYSLISQEFRCACASSWGNPAAD